MTNGSIPHSDSDSLQQWRWVLSVWNQGTVPTRFVHEVENVELSSIFVKLEVFDVCLTVFQIPI